MDPVGDRSIGVLVEYQVRTDSVTVDEWLDVWGDRGEDARVGEPETAAYASLRNIDDDPNILVFERYDHGDRSLAAHMARPAHATLTEVMGARNMTKRRVMTVVFSELADHGWWSRPNSVDPSALGTILVASGMRCTVPEDFAFALALIRAHGEYCSSAEPETLIYGAGLAVSKADREVDLNQGDLVLVTACTDMDAVKRHANDPGHRALFAELEAAQVRLERTFTRTYRSTGHGFLWRA